MGSQHQTSTLVSEPTPKAAGSSYTLGWSAGAFGGAGREAQSPRGDSEPFMWLMPLSVAPGMFPNQHRCGESMHVFPKDRIFKVGCGALWVCVPLGYGRVLGQKGVVFLRAGAFHGRNGEGKVWSLRSVVLMLKLFRC